MNQQQTQVRTQIPPELYVDVERAVMPIIRGASNRFAKMAGLDASDAVQEGRLALLEALGKYDYNLSRGGIYNYARSAVHQAMLGVLYKATTLGRLPHLVIEDNGELKTVRSWPALMADFDTAVNESAPDPEREAMDSEMQSRLGELNMRLKGRLTDFQQNVLACLSNQNPSFALFLRNIQKDEEKAIEEKHTLIAKFFGETKNVVDWAVHHIKKNFTELAEEQFSDIVLDALDKGAWPMFHVSNDGNDTEFINITIEENDLDPRPSGPPEVKRVEIKGVVTARSIENYSWGSIIHLRHGDQVATVIAEGRFNAISGEVLTDTGLWKSIKDRVPWYPTVQRILSKV
jgi:hypothetical protein